MIMHNNHNKQNKKDKVILLSTHIYSILHVSEKKFLKTRQTNYK